MTKVLKENPRKDAYGNVLYKCVNSKCTDLISLKLHL